MTELLRAIAGFLVWAFAFGGVYALQGFGCAAGWSGIRVGPTSLLRLLLLAAAALGLAVIAGLALRHRGRAAVHDAPEDLFAADWLARRLTIAALAATAWTLFPVLFASLCG